MIGLFSITRTSHIPRQSPLSSFVRLIPLFIVVISGFVLYQLFMAAVFARGGQWPFAGIYALMAVAGVALIRTLVINKRKLSPPSR